MLSTPIPPRGCRDRPARSTPGGHEDPTKAPAPDRERDLAQDEIIVCASCGNPVAMPSAAISVDGSHDHTFVNPHGIVFKVRCFADTLATDVSGDPSTDWSWFPGFAWQIEICASCTAHLGWLFRGPQTEFHGLIAERLAGGPG